MALQCAVKNMSIPVIDPSTGPGPFFNQEWAAQFEEPSTESKEQVTQTVDCEEDVYLDYEVHSIRRSRSSKRKRKSFENSFGIKGHKVAKRVKESRAQKKSLRSRTSKTLPVPIKNTCPDCGRRVTCTCAQEEECERRYERYLLDQYEELRRTEDDEPTFGERWGIREVCDDCLRYICMCDAIEEEFGYMRNYRTHGETWGKYVCKGCHKLPVQCICWESDPEDEKEKSTAHVIDDQTRCLCYQCVENREAMHMYDDEHSSSDDECTDDRCDCGDCPDCGVPRPHMIGLWGYRAAMIGTRRW